MKNKNLKKPFFANFIENQAKDLQNVKGGKTAVSAQTSPWRDNVSTPGKDHVTMKWPSDGDEHTI